MPSTSGTSTTSGTTSPSAGPTSKVASAPTSNVSSSGGAVTSTSGTSTRSGTSESTSINFNELKDGIAENQARTQADVDALRDKGEPVSITDMFEQQMLENMSKQRSEMSSAAVSASK
jgi:hypothetical protein